MDKQTLGKWGEELVAKQLKKMGFILVETNFYTRYGEIDIVAREKGEYVFIEVKTRSNQKYGTASESIDDNKKSKFLKACQYYLKQKNLEDSIYRFDVATLEKKENGKWKMELYRNAFS
jgi:putative endonuclease